MVKPFVSRLYLVVGREECVGNDILTVTEQAVKGGVDLVQLREKHLTDMEFLHTALQMREMLDKHNVPLIINDNVRVAQECGAFGIHVGNNDMPPSQIKVQWPACGLLGYSLEYISQLQSLEMQYADYLGVSPIFSTPTKIDTVTQWGLEGIAKIRGLTNKPLVAIGAMNTHNAYDAIRAGANCIAVVSAISRAENPAKAAWEIRNEIERAL